MQFTSADGERKYAALVRAAREAVVGLDFDGTLAPIVDDPERAHIHPDARDVLVDLAGEVSAIAVITGRPARQVLDLGGLEEMGEAIGRAGRELYVFGQYGNERWTASRRRIVSPRPPRGLATFLRELPDALRAADAEDAWVEDKGLAYAVHTRRMADPEAAFERLVPVLRGLAERTGLALEPGRQVVEVRAPGTDKGKVVERLVQETNAGAFVFAGDDLGDLEAFDAVGRLQKGGLPTLLVSAAPDDSPLVPRSDVVAPGPDGVLAVLRRLTSDVRAARS